MEKSTNPSFMVGDRMKKRTLLLPILLVLSLPGCWGNKSSNGNGSCANGTCTAFSEESEEDFNPRPQSMYVFRQDDHCPDESIESGFDQDCGEFIVANNDENDEDELSAMEHDYSAYALADEDESKPECTDGMHCEWSDRELARECGECTQQATLVAENESDELEEKSVQA
jgi:hypothetical protein